MRHLILLLFIFSTDIFAVPSQRLQNCLTSRLSPAISPTPDQLLRLQSGENVAMTDILARAGTSVAEQQRLRRERGEPAVRQLFRRFVMQARPGVYTKHLAARTPDEARRISAGETGSAAVRGEAQFMPGLVRERLEARALREMPGVYRQHEGSVFKFVKFRMKQTVQTKPGFN
jgi:hypothetical protein